LQSIPELACNPLAERIVQTLLFNNGAADSGLATPCDYDILDDYEIDFLHFLSILDVFSSKSSFDSKIQFAFDVYDSKNDRVIDKQEMEYIFQATIQDSQLYDEKIKDLSSQMFSHRDALTFEDFKHQARGFRQSLTIVL